MGGYFSKSVASQPQPAQLSAEKPQLYDTEQGHAYNNANRFVTGTDPTALTVPHPKYPQPNHALKITVQEDISSRLGSTSTIQTENQEELKTDPPSPKYSWQWLNVLRWEWLSVYRRLNLIVLTVNIVIIIAFAAQSRLLSLDPDATSTALAANITTAVLFRQDYVVNALFVVFGLCSPRWPLWFRQLAAKIYHFGGVHSGAGTASLIWLALFDMSIYFTYQHARLAPEDLAVICVTSTLNILLCCVVVSSLPKIREKYHDLWEAIHRFGGWLAVALFWTNFVLLIIRKHNKLHPDRPISSLLVTSATFWMLVIITICIVLPWLRLRRVPVHAELQSKFAIRLHFTYTNLPLCAAPRFSKSPLRDWHSFAGIPEENGEGFSVLVSGVGDWTKELVNNPPKMLWTRGIPVRGVLHIAPIFSKIILVATGSGIGPVLSLLCAPNQNVCCRILWCTRDPVASYQPNILQQVFKADPNAVIINRVKGTAEPELGQLAYSLYQEMGAEAVFVISNKQGCYSSRIWLESRGICVFTPIFDS